MPVAISTRDKTWSKMFPTAFKTEQQSLVFMKKLFAVAISNVVYMRAIFPEYAFFDKQLEGIKLKILREDSKCPGATKVISWVRGCFDALDKNYLRSVIVGFYTDPSDPDTVIESYSFKFTYDKDGVSVSVNTENEKEGHNNVICSTEPPEKIKKATLSLLRTMILAGNTQSPLPEKVIMTMKLLYYDEVTPEDYEPMGFKASDYAGYRHETETINAKLGHVLTDYHSFRMILRTDKNTFAENYMKEDLNSTVDSESKVVCIKEKEKEKVDAEVEENTVEETANDETTNDEVAGEAEEDFTVRCPCGGNKDDGIMIMCENCKNWQHSICYSINKEEDVPEIHICDICGDNDIIGPTCPEMASLSINERQNICLMRRSLHHCQSFDMIDPQQLSQVLGIELNVARGIFQLLQNEGVLVNGKRKSKAKGLTKMIDKKCLKEQIETKYFIKANTTKTKEISTKENNKRNKKELPAEMNASQDSVTDGPPIKRTRACVVNTPIMSTTK